MRSRYTSILGASGLLVAALVGCTDGEVTLVVDLRTDFAAGVEFTAVETSLGGAPATSLTVAEGQRFVEGRRIAELDGLAEGTVTVDVQLIGPSGVVGQRRIVVDLSGSTGITVVIARACRDVSCPRPGDGSDQTECLGSFCVPPECTPENPAACGAPECTADDQCPGGAPCAVATCAAGACLLHGDDSSCASDERCDVVDGCVEVRPRTDAGPVDASGDTSPDGGCLPTGSESCNGLDDDCDGMIDDGTDCIVDSVTCVRMERGTSVYQFCDASRPWDMARTYCESIGYDLVVIDDGAENTFVATSFGSVVTVGSNGWIGLSDIGTEGEWRWVDGTIDSVAAWDVGQPDDAAPGEDCVITLFSSALWSDIVCDGNEPFACEVVTTTP